MRSLLLQYRRPSHDGALATRAERADTGDAAAPHAATNTGPRGGPLASTMAELSPSAASTARAPPKFESKRSVAKAPPATAQFVCDECGKGFALRRGLKTHHRQVHQLNKYGDWTPNM